MAVRSVMLSLIIVSLASTALSSTIKGGRTECPEGYILWAKDSTCHRPLLQGPCEHGQVLLLDHFQHALCSPVTQEEEDSDNGVGNMWALGTIIKEQPQEVMSIIFIVIRTIFDRHWEYPLYISYLRQFNVPMIQAFPIIPQ